MVEIDNSALLVNLFGHWPDFHDAELRGLRLEAPHRGQPSLEADIEVAEMSLEVDARGYFRERQRVLTTLRFANVLEVAVSDFRDQNVLDALEIRDSTAEGSATDLVSGVRRYRVTFVPISGYCGVTFLCDGIEVLRARPMARAT